MQKVALTIGGSDSSGGAGIQADLKSFMIAGVHGTSVITCATSQNTMGVRDIYPLPIETVESQIDAILDDFDVGAAKTGMLYTPEIAKLVAEKMGEIKLVVDPVLISTTEHSLSLPHLAGAIKRYLVPSCHIIIPNIREAERLCGMKLNDMEDVKNACTALHEMGAENVLVKGGHLKGNASDILFDGDRFYTFTLPRMNRKAHGSGCTFSALITAFLVGGEKLTEVARKAKAYTWSSITGGISPGKGVAGVDIVRQRADHIPVVDELGKSNKEKTEVWLSLQNAVDEVLSFIPASLIPEVGINFVYALRGASCYRDACGIEGRVVKAGKEGNAFQAGECRFGASKHISSIVLACMKYDGNVRAVMNIAYSADTVNACRAAGLTIGNFDRKDEPAGESTMEWGTEHAIKSTGFIPDVVWDGGGAGKEAMIRVIGKNPAEIVEKVRKIITNL